MGRSDAVLKPVYAKLAKQVGPRKSMAVLGSPLPYFVSNMFADAQCDYFDLSLGNWQINSDWTLGKTYDLILCTRCPYFAKNPQQFIEKCHAHLNPGGAVLIDWGYGDHWRFPKYKIGWVKDGEQEHCYGENNYLWSGIWDDSFLQHPEFKKFSGWVQKFGYYDVKKAIFEETPAVLELSFIKQYFNTTVELLALWESSPQFYVFVVGFAQGMAAQIYSNMPVCR